MTEKSDLENEDKHMIGEEEREKMLSAEYIINDDTKEKMDEIDKDKINEKECEKDGKAIEEGDGVLKAGEVEKRKKQLEESQKEGRGKIRVPIGAIKIPGFLRTKDKNKDADGNAEEDVDLLETSTQKPEEPSVGFRATLTRRWETLAAKNPFSKKETVDGDEQKPNLLDRIKAVPVLPKRFTRGNKDQKHDGEQGAELASVETLEDRKQSMDDGMESVKLDGDEKDESDAEKAGLAGDGEKKPFYLVALQRLNNLSQHEKAIVGVVLFLIILIIIIASSVGSSPTPTAPPIVNGKVITTTQCGPVEGKVEDGIHVFRGIPYAVPPVGKLRWQPAHPLNNISLCWDGVFLAHNASRICWQQIDKGQNDGYEDCLTLDVYSPEVRYINPVPVVVLIDAVTLNGGPPGVLQPTPKIIRTKEVVFVKPNFRLSVLGFLAASQLRANSYPPTTGNYGLTDILVALRWVETNIGHFGGDPNQVTVLGHRAGATLVTALTASPLAKGLFKKAWVSSGSAIYPGDQDTNLERQYLEFANSICKDTTLECLLDTKAEILMENFNLKEDWQRPVLDIPMSLAEASNNTHGWLFFDEHIIRQHVWSADTELQAKLVVGTTADCEASYGLWEKSLKYPGGKENGIRNHIQDSMVGRGARDAISLYKNNWEGLVAMTSDIRTVCPLLAMTSARAGNMTFYVATLARNHSGIGHFADGDLDMSAIMGTYEPQAAPQRKFVSTMQDFFYKFVETGELPKAPNHQSKTVLNVSTTLEWQQEYSHCKIWINENLVPLYARKD